MKEMTMLDLERVDLGELCMALEDNSAEHEWYVDAANGMVGFRSEYFDEDALDADQQQLVPIEPLSSAEAYGDMEEFIARVTDRRARELLERAIAGRGAFRRFKDTLWEVPELRDAWFGFHNARMRRRAIGWLRDVELIDDAVAERAVNAVEEPTTPLLVAAVDGAEVAAAVARDLRDLYGDRLCRVLLMGSWARDEASVDSDVDLLVVLDEVPARATEMDRMDAVLWRHSLANEVVVTELPVSQRDFDESDEPMLIRARAEGVPVG